MAESRKRLRSLSPQLRPSRHSSSRPSRGHITNHEVDANREAKLQVLKEVLRRTSLTELRDREIVEWLTDADTWLRGSAGENVEVRHLVVGVLHTLPWWRVVESVDDMSTSSPLRNGGLAAATTAADVAGSKEEKGNNHTTMNSSSNGNQASASVATSDASDTARRRTTARVLTRWHEKIQHTFERVCVTLIDHSKHCVPAVLEVLMKPFSVRPPVRDGAHRVIPSDSVIRVLNFVATRYSSTYVLDLLDKCISDIIPKRRWSNRRHHVACTAVFLYMALEGHVPVFHLGGGSSGYGSNSQSLELARDLIAKSSSNHGNMAGGGGGGGQREQQQQHPAQAMLLPKSTGSIHAAAGGDGGGHGQGGGFPATSEESGTDGYTRRGGGMLHGGGSLGLELPQRKLIPSASDVELSDATMDLSNTRHQVLFQNLGGKSTAAAAAVGLLDAGGGGGAAGVSTNNKLLTCRNELIGFILHRLLEMELTLERVDDDDDRHSNLEETLSGCGSPRSFTCVGGSEGSSRGTSFPNSPVPSLFPEAPSTFAGAIGGQTSSCNNTATRYPQHSQQHRTPQHSFYRVDSIEDANPEEQFAPTARPFFRILCDCTTLVFRRLADDLRRQQTAGACGNADWWRELLVFHQSVLLRVERPVCLLYLAPSLARLGCEEECVDMLHKLISLVTKGYMPLQAPPQHTVGPRPPSLGPTRIRMAPPTVGAQTLPMVQRVRAATMIYPMFKYMRDRLSGGEGLRKRLLKWVAQELRKGCAAGGGGAQMRSQQSVQPSRLVDVVFAQCAAISELMGVSLAPGVVPAAASSTNGSGALDENTTGDAKVILEGTAVSQPSGDKFSTSSLTQPDWLAEALQPLISKYALHSMDPLKSTSDTMKLDLVQMELEGLLRPTVMDRCPWADDPLSQY